MSTQFIFLGFYIYKDFSRSYSTYIQAHTTSNVSSGDTHQLI